MSKLRIFLNELSAAFQESRAKQSSRIFILERITSTCVSLLKILSKSKRISELIKFKEGSHGFFLGSSYFITHNAGLMSCASTTLSDIMRSQRQVMRIKSTFGMSLYKRGLLADNWTKFFKSPQHESLTITSTSVDPNETKVHDWWSRDYKTLPLNLVRNTVVTYFTESSEVSKKKETFLAQYGIRPHDTIGVHYRGTDKAIEIGTPSLQDFVHETRLSIEGITNPQILLLTDEPLAQKVFRETFPDSVILIEELEAPGGTVGAHILDSKEVETRAQTFLAILLIIAQSKKVVTHTGNGALWEVLFRGRVDEVSQIRKKSD